MKKCSVCRKPATWTWQPFGPAENTDCFTAPGSHYRGFAAVGICSGCKRIIQTRGDLDFVYGGQTYHHDGRTMSAY